MQDTVNVKLSDYGISRQSFHEGALGVEGTPGYQAPEIRPGIVYDEKVSAFFFFLTHIRKVCNIFWNVVWFRFLFCFFRLFFFFLNDENKHIISIETDMLISWISTYMCMTCTQHLYVTLTNHVWAGFASRKNLSGELTRKTLVEMLFQIKVVIVWQQYERWDFNFSENNLGFSHLKH